MTLLPTTFPTPLSGLLSIFFKEKKFINPNLVVIDEEKSRADIAPHPSSGLLFNFLQICFS